MKPFKIFHKFTPLEISSSSTPSSSITSPNLQVAFNNLEPIKDTLVSQRVALHDNFLELVGKLHRVLWTVDVRHRFWLGFNLLKTNQLIPFTTTKVNSFTNRYQPYSGCKKTQ
jgi:hypothetical protein